MADTGMFAVSSLQTWQRDAIQKALQLLHDRFGNPPTDPQILAAHDLLLEVLEPSRRTARLQREMNAATRKAENERRAKERRGKDRRKVDIGPPPGVSERRVGERRKGDRRNRS